MHDTASTSPAPSAFIVGAGLMGRWHADALRRIGVPIVAAIDPDLDAAARVAGSAGRAFASLGDAMASGTATAAHVCSPSSTHPVIVRELLEAGIHVLVEKPLAADASETRALLDQAQNLGRHLCPVHQFLFQTGFEKAAAALQTAGGLLHVDAVAVSAGAEGAGPDRAEEVMTDILPHPLSIARRLLGVDFRDATWSVHGGRPGELRASGNCGPTSLGILISMAGRPTRNTVRLTCERGTFHVDLFHGFMVREPPTVSRRRKILRPFGVAWSSASAAGLNLAARGVRREAAYPGLRALCQRFYAAASGSGPVPIEPTETLDVASARDDILRKRSSRVIRSDAKA